MNALNIFTEIIQHIYANKCVCYAFSTWTHQS